MPKRIGFVPYNTVKDYIKDVHNMRSDKAGTKKLVSRINSIIKTVISEAKTLAKKEDRKTIISKDMKTALENNIGKKHLNWQETLKEVLKQTPADLGKISKGVNKYIETNKK